MQFTYIYTVRRDSKFDTNTWLCRKCSLQFKNNISGWKRYREPNSIQWFCMYLAIFSPFLRLLFWKLISSRSIIAKNTHMNVSWQSMWSYASFCAHKISIFFSKILQATKHINHSIHSSPTSIFLTQKNPDKEYKIWCTLRFFHMWHINMLP